MIRLVPTGARENEHCGIGLLVLQKLDGCGGSRGYWKRREEYKSANRVIIMCRVIITH